MRATLVAIAAVAALPACLGPRTDTSRYFTLPAPPATEPASGTAFASAGLGPVTLPPYLARPEVAVRVGTDELAYAAGDRWAAPLDELVARSLADELRSALPAREVVRWPWPLGDPPEVTASVDLLRFEADSAGGATVLARWTVAVKGREPARGETRFQEKGQPGDVPGSVAALGRGLRAVAADLGSAARAKGR